MIICRMVDLQVSSTVDTGRPPKELRENPEKRRHTSKRSVFIFEFERGQNLRLFWAAASCASLSHHLRALLVFYLLGEGNSQEKNTKKKKESYIITTEFF